jgi:hypothetical protein
VKLSHLLFVLTVSFSSLLSAQTITLFDGTGGFVVESEWTTFDYDSVEGKLLVEGTGRDQLSVSFDPVQIMDPYQIYLTTTLHTEEGIYFNAQFYNTDDSRIMYFEGWMETVGVSSTILLNYRDDILDNDFFYDIAAAEFFMGGFPLNAVEITFESLVSIPEPSTYVLVVSGLLAGALWFRRRGRQVVSR